MSSLKLKWTTQAAGQARKIGIEVSAAEHVLWASERLRHNLILRDAQIHAQIHALVQIHAQIHGMLSAASQVASDRTPASSKQKTQQNWHRVGSSVLLLNLRSLLVCAREHIDVF